MVFIETPTNPLLKVFDIRAIAEIAKNNGALFCVDNTFLTPYFQRPLELGADLSSYSLTKYMNGHTDVIMGAIVTNNKDLHDKLRFLQNSKCICELSNELHVDHDWNVLCCNRYLHLVHVSNNLKNSWYRYRNVIYCKRNFFVNMEYACSNVCTYN